MSRLLGNPALVLYALNAVVAWFVSFGLPLSTPKVEAITVLATAVLSVAAALMTRPIVVSTISAAAATGLAALAAFGWHLSANQIGSTVVVVSLALAFWTHQNVSPKGGVLDA